MLENGSNSTLLAEHAICVLGEFKMADRNRQVLI